METSEKKRILVIEDEEHIADGLKLNLQLQGYDVKIAIDGLAGLEKWRTWHPNLIVLDIMLPLMDGYSVLKNIRDVDEKLPVLILSAKGNAEDKIKGLRFGVDDYLSKPFDLDEFLLRIDRLLTKQNWYYNDKKKVGAKELFAEEKYSFGGNKIDFITYKAKCKAGEITLTDQEIILLKIFIANKDKPLSRQELLKAGWGYSSDTSTRTVDNFIVRFRKYFEKNPKKPHFFKSMRSVGYLFNHDNDND
ncbi:MAG: response regulator transcription factor [Desulfobacteraceae bacterium]|nr:response regulator transcription factor [Desulfobacteraceae bacterium]